MGARQRVYTKVTQVIVGAASSTLWTRVPSASALVLVNTHATQAVWMEPTGVAAVLGDGIYLGPQARLVFGDSGELPMPAANVTGWATGAATNVSVYWAAM